MAVSYVERPNNFLDNKKTEYNQPLIIAHRGYAKNTDFDRNTIPAFKHAIELGAHGLETDLRLTKDHKVISNHGPFVREGLWLKRIRTSNYEELVDFTGSTDQIPEIKLIFDLLPEEMPLFVQIKNPDTFIPILRELQRVAPGAKNLIIMAYMDQILNHDLPDHYIYGKHYLLPTSSNVGYILSRQADGYQVPIASPYYRLMTDAHLEYIHSLNLQSVLYTINNPDHVKRYLKRDVTVIYTDNLEKSLEL